MAKNKDTDSGQGAVSLGWWISGGLLVVLVVAVVVGVIIWPRDTAPEPGATAPAPSQDATATPTQRTPVSGAPCETANPDQSFPTEAPETTWATHPYEILMPVSEKYGPSNRDGNLWSCFERSPTGAVFAGPNLLTAISMGEADAAIPGPGRDEAMALYEEADDDFERPVVEGFRILAADENSATIDYWMTGQGQTASYGLDLVWDDDAGDWKLNFETPGEHPRVALLEDTAPYVRWR
ncbi:hypothetical protein [Citricoccus sp. GCM10030269]|uniref:hypothetical protein n=1 Tax=Citricoccus sp. GCM10030269 TaxID=3273388 RepID=UPI0036117CF8